MRILDDDNDQPRKSISIFLTTKEAAEFRDSLEALLQRGVGSHEHISSPDWSKEVTIALYEPDSAALANFSERARRLIAEDV